MWLDIAPAASAPRGRGGSIGLSSQLVLPGHDARGYLGDGVIFRIFLDADSMRSDVTLEADEPRGRVGQP